MEARASLPGALKRRAAAEALERVRSGMRLGLGTGSTVDEFLDLLARRIREGVLEGVVGVPTSVHTADRAHSLGIPLGPLHELAPLHLTVDGADEIDPRLDLVKGLGGALLRERMVAFQSRKLVIIADEGKRVQRLGSRCPIPVEVVAFAWQVHLPFLESLGAEPRLRVHADGSPVATDNGNYVIDARFPRGLEDPAGLEDRLREQPGVVATGLFLGLATEALVAGPSGVEVLRKLEPGRAGDGGGP